MRQRRATQTGMIHRCATGATRFHTHRRPASLQAWHETRALPARRAVQAFDNWNSDEQETSLHSATELSRGEASIDYQRHTPLAQRIMGGTGELVKRSMAAPSCRHLATCLSIHDTEGNRGATSTTPVLVSPGHAPRCRPTESQTPEQIQQLS